VKGKDLCERTRGWRERREKGGGKEENSPAREVNAFQCKKEEKTDFEVKREEIPPAFSSRRGGRRGVRVISKK